MPILVTYATSHGSTREIAERIAARLHNGGYAVDCRSVNHVHSVDRYSAVILGSAVHSHRWHVDAVKFLDVEAMSLSRRPTWTFSVSMATAAAPSWIRRREVKKEIHNVEDNVRTKVPRVRDHRLFAGKEDGSSISMPVRAICQGLGCRFGDLRDWNEIDAWADVIAKELAVDSA